MQVSAQESQDSQAIFEAVKADLQLTLVRLRVGAGTPKLEHDAC